MRRELLILFLFPFTNCYAQADSTQNGAAHSFSANHFTKTISVLTGLKYYKRTGLEIGIALKKDAMYNHTATMVVYLSNEFFYDKSLFIGPKIGFWLGGGVAGLMMGLSAVYYTNFDTYTFRLQPEFGMGFGRFRIYYARNFGLTNRNYDRMGEHLFGLNILFDVRKLKAVTNYASICTEPVGVFAVFLRA